ncbi:MAG TPA: VWA domain-containing protein [Actinocatenispora sp.]
MRTLRRLVAVAAATALGAALAPVAASAAPAGTDLAPMMLVVDASGSMADRDPSGGTRIAAARTAVHELVRQLPDDARVGLTTYGTRTGSSDAEKARGCRDVTVLRKVGPLDRGALTGAVDSLTPRGYTPIGRSLRTAVAALPSDGPRSVVLVSDGIDTCAPPDPCAVAAELHKADPDLRVHTVGYGVDGAARKQLACLAQATGGTYADAPDAAALRQVLPRVTAGALRNYEPAGTRVTGTDGQDDAPVLAPGRYLDVAVLGRERYYRVAAAGRDTLYFTASVPLQRSHSAGDGDVALDVRMYAPDGRNCQVHERGHTTAGMDGGAVTATVAFTPSKSTVDSCRAGGRYGFRVTYGRSTGQPAELPLEMQVGVEPALAGSSGPAAATAPVAFAAPTGTPAAVTGGGSFSSAAVLPGTGVYTDVLQNTEYVYYRVRLAWGQGLAYRVRIGAAAGWEAGDDANVGTAAYSPFRADVAAATSSYRGTARDLPADAGAVRTLPVRYRNRELGDDRQRRQSVAGWYYVSVKLGRQRAHPAAEHAVPVRIELSVVGHAEPGPTYASATASPATAPKRTATRAAGFPVVPVVGGAAGLVAVAALAGVVVAVLRRRT